VVGQAIAWVAVCSVSFGVAEDSVPSLPGAVTRPPDWIGKTAPFDVAAFFKAPPPDENAAPLYLDALFEFSSALAVYFPEGPEQDQRVQAVDDRWRRYNEIRLALRDDPKSVSGESIDTLLGEYNEGFRKLAVAQEQPRCVFQTGLGMTAVLPHLKAASRFRNIFTLKIGRDLEQGNLNQGLHDLARLLRTSRDLVPGGEEFAGLASVSLLKTAVDLVVAFMPHPALTLQHCDRLLGMLAEHDSESIDMDSECLRAEYVNDRATPRDLVFHQDQLRVALKGFSRDVTSSVTVEIVEPRVTLLTDCALPQRELRQRFKNLALRLISLHETQGLDARMAQMTPEEMTRQVEKMNAFFRDRLALSPLPHIE
jgi:hypothetical protein